MAVAPADTPQVAKLSAVIATKLRGAVARPPLGRLLSSALVVAGLGWVAYLLGSSVENPARFLPARPGWLFLASVLAGGGMATNIVVFHSFLRMQESRPTPAAFSARLYLVGQLLRYLPGRVWGIAYQIGASRGTFPASRVAFVNVALVVFYLLGNTLVSLAILAERSGVPLGTVLLCLGVGLAGLFVFFPTAGRLVARIARWLAPEGSALPIAFDRLRSGGSRFAPVMLAFVSGWAAYLAGWTLLGRAYPEFSGVDFAALCAHYTLASAVGIASALTPSGLGVREAAFVLLAREWAPPEVGAFFALFARVWLTLLEVLLLAGLGGVFFLRRKKVP